MFGDHGRILGVDRVGANFAANRPIGDPSPTKTDDDYQVQVLGLVTSIATAAADGSGDTITTGIGRDMIFGGQGGDTINAFADKSGSATADGNTIVFGDHGLVDYLAEELAAPLAANPPRTLDIDRVWSIDTALGGADTISTGDRNDIVLGGIGGDVLSSGNGSNIVLGDSGELTAAPFDTGTTPWAVHEFRICDITTTGPADGGTDNIRGGSGSEVIFGGAGSDEIYAGAGNDLVFADQGEIHCANGQPFDPDVSLPPICSDIFPTKGFLEFHTIASTSAGNDLIYGQDGMDVIFGQEGDDVLYGGNDDDIVVGGSNQSGVADGNDRIDGGAGHDAIAGDNADICYRPDNLDPRMRVLPGTLLYGTTIGVNDGAALVNPLTSTVTPPNDDPRGNLPGNAAPVHREYHIVLLDHSVTTTAGLYGNDYIAGGAGEDEIFGQLGNDVIQGDGKIGTDTRTDTDVGIPNEGAPTLFGASRGAPATTGTVGDLAAGVGTLTITASLEAASDGDDYIEGNGGNDVIFGNLGQDDIIGGSSDLYALTLATQRPDGDDLIFGGAGTPADTDRNAAGDTGVRGHAIDADTIVGDNGRILRIVGVNGTPRGTAPSTANDVSSSGGFVNYNYDALFYAADADPATYDRIIVRAVEHLDYTPGGIDFNGTPANADIGGNDELHGEAGDDFIYGQKGNDILYGEGQDDDLIGGYGNDWISGGAGDDAVIGDDGRILGSRNSAVYGEPLNGAAKLLATDPDTRNPNGNVLNELITTPGTIQSAVINVADTLRRAVNLTPFSFDKLFNANTDEFAGGNTRPHNADDIIFGGLGNDALHGGSGDDAISGAEALATAYTQVFDAAGALIGIARSDYSRPYNPVDVLRFNPTDVNAWHFDRTGRSGEFRLYDEYDPLRKIELNANGSANKTANGVEWFLNFATNEGPSVTSATYGTRNNDGYDQIFGDLGNDWLVGGTGRDNLYGGFGNDLLNADDDPSTNGELNNTSVGTLDTHPSYEDRAYGGAGRDVLIANTGGDRLIDWVGEFNSYLVPFAPFGMATVSRTLQPQLAEFLYALSRSDGADPTRAADVGPSAEAIRNGEPFGELGIVRQKDFAWHDQTGGPTDPQAGNIPGGKRDVLRSASFDDGTLQALAPDSGVWTVAAGTLQVAAASPHSDAVSVYQVGDALPSYYEVQATIRATKPTSGWNANSYVVFDYQSQTNFKFAGIDVSTNKLVMGHRNASGWIIDSQAAFPGSVKSDTWYNMLLSVNGLTATLVVNNSTSFSFTFTPTVVDGWSYGLNWGLVGFGSNNSRGEMDNIAVQIVPPAATVTKSADFATAAGPLFNGASTGAWTAAAGRYGGAAVAPADTAINLINLGGVTQLTSTSMLDLSAVVKTAGRAGFVFDRYSDTDFKFAAIDVVTKQVMIGHRSGNNWVIDAAVSSPTLNATTDYTLGVTVRGSTVSVTLNIQAAGGSLAAVGFAFNGVAVDGRFGIFGRGASASFDSLTVKTNDPAVPALQGSVVTASAAATDVARVSTTQLQPLVAEAARRWSIVEDASITAKLGRIEVGVADLPAGQLADYADGRITIDIDADGQGWFIDPTPRNDSEFTGRGAVRVARVDGAAAGQIDLLSVLAHEMGHAIGFGHSAGGVMDEQRLVGERALPDAWFAAAASTAGRVPDAAAATPAASAFDPMPAAAGATIDWTMRASTPATPRGAAADTGLLRADDRWQQRFVNHLGATPERLNPNAGLKVHLPIVSRLTTL